MKVILIVSLVILAAGTIVVILDILSRQRWSLSVRQFLQRNPDWVVLHTKGYGLTVAGVINSLGPQNVQFPESVEFYSWNKTDVDILCAQSGFQPSVISRIEIGPSQYSEDFGETHDVLVELYEVKSGQLLTSSFSRVELDSGLRAAIDDAVAHSGQPDLEVIPGGQPIR